MELKQFMKNRITDLFSIKYPIIQAGMVWCSGWRLASAVSEAGGLGIIGAGSMYPDIFREHLTKYKAASGKPFAVNVPLMYPQVEELMKLILEYKVPFVFTSAGNPKTWTSFLQENGIKVVHVVSSVKFALKSQEAGVDAVVCEGFEAGGHNGREETTSLCLIPAVSQALDIPVIAAGGISSGKAMMAAFALGAEGVQIGSRFAISEESSAHPEFKKRVIEAHEGETILTLKMLAPVRLIKNEFYQEILKLEQQPGTKEAFASLLGRGRAKRGIFEGNLKDGELEIGQVSSMIHDIRPAASILEEIWKEFIETKSRIQNL